MTDLSGQHIQGYILDRLIGEGGMGSVYHALDTHTNHQVAVKCLKSNILEDAPDILERFRREGEILRKLNHPNIVQVLETLEVQERYYIVMEYVGGGSLRHLLDQQPRLPIDRVLSIALELADALARAHHLNVIHRDIKPANVLLAEDGTPRLSDFGTAFMSDKPHITEMDLVVGTPDYISPESFNQKAIDQRTDVWSFGVMLFEMLSGERPFGGKTILEMVNEILQKSPSDLQTIRPDIPPELATLVRGMLQKDIAARIPSMRHIAAELERISRGEKSSTSSNISNFLSDTPTISAPQIVTPLPAPSLSIPDSYSSDLKPPRNEQQRLSLEELETFIQKPQLPPHREVMAIVWDVLQFYHLPESRDTALRLLNMLSQHADLRASTGYEINQILSAARVKLNDENSATTKPALRSLSDSLRRPRSRLFSSLTFWAIAISLLLVSVAAALFYQNRTLITPLTAAQPSSLILPTSITEQVPPTPIPTPHRIDELDNRAGWITSVRFDLNGRRVITTSTDGAIRVWNSSIKALEHVLSAGNEARSALAADYFSSGFDLTDMVVAGYADGSIRLWLVTASQPVRIFRGHIGSVLGLAYSPQGDHLVSAGQDGTIRIWDLKQTNTTAAIVWKGHDGPVLDVAYSPDGNHVASAGADGTVRIWDTHTGSAQVLAGHIDAVWSVAFSPNGQFLASGDNTGTIKFWRASTGVQLEDLHGHAGPIYDVAFSSDGSLVSSASLDTTIKIWDFASGTLLTTIMREAPVLSVNFSPDDQQLVFGLENGTWGVLRLSNKKGKT